MMDDEKVVRVFSSITQEWHIAGVPVYRKNEFQLSILKIMHPACVVYCAQGNSRRFSDILGLLSKAEGGRLILAKIGAAFSQEGFGSALL